MLYVLIGYLVALSVAMAGFYRLGICSNSGDMFLLSTEEQKACARRKNTALAAALVVLALVICCVVVCVVFAGTALGIAAAVLLVGATLAVLVMGLRKLFQSAARDALLPALQG